MADILTKENLSSANEGNILPPCRVCGEEATGFHYGVNTCGGCKGFFGRSLSRAEAFTCVGSGNCSVKTKGKRKRLCQKCRFEKCLRVGMSKDAIKTGRYSYTKKTQDYLEVKGKMPPDKKCLQNLKTGQNFKAEFENEPIFEMVEFDDSSPHKKAKFVENHYMENSPNSSGNEYEYRETQNNDFINQNTLSKNTYTVQKPDYSIFLSNSNSSEFNPSKFKHADYFVNFSPDVPEHDYFSQETSNEFIYPTNNNLNIDSPRNFETEMLYNKTFPNGKQICSPLSDSMRNLSNKIRETNYQSLNELDDSTAYLDNQYSAESSPILQYTTVQNNINTDFLDSPQSYQSNQNFENENPETLASALSHQENPMMDNQFSFGLKNGGNFDNSFSIKIGEDELLKKGAFFKVRDFTDFGKQSDFLAKLKKCKSLSEQNRIIMDGVSEDVYEAEFPSAKLLNSAKLFTLSKVFPELSSKIGVTYDITDDKEEEVLYLNQSSATLDKDGVLNLSKDNRSVVKVPLVKSSKAGSNISIGEEAKSPVRFSKLFVQERATILPIVRQLDSDLMLVPRELPLSKKQVLIQLKRSGMCSTFYSPTNNIQIEHHLPDISYLKKIIEKTGSAILGDFHCEFNNKELMIFMEQLISAHNEVIQHDTNTIDSNELEAMHEACEMACKEHKEHSKECEIDFFRFCDVFEETGTDLDGRRALVTTLALMFETAIRKAVRFFKSVPEFMSFSLEDQIALIKGGMYEFFLLGCFRGNDCQRRVTIDSELSHIQCEHDLRKLFPDNYIDIFFKVSQRLQELDLNPAMIILLKAIAVTAPDREKLQNPETVDKFHWKLVTCLRLMLHVEGRADHLPNIIMALSDMRELSHMCWKWCIQTMLYTPRVRLNFIETPLFQETFFNP